MSDVENPTTEEEVAEEAAVEEDEIAQEEDDDEAAAVEGKPVGASVVGALFAGVAFALSLAANYSCYYVIVKKDGAPHISRGIWQGMNDENAMCGGYSDDISFGTQWKSARVFSVMVTIIGSFAMISIMGLTQPLPNTFVPS